MYIVTFLSHNHKIVKQSKKINPLPSISSITVPPLVVDDTCII